MVVVEGGPSGGGMRVRDGAREGGMSRGAGGRGGDIFRGVCFGCLVVVGGGSVCRGDVRFELRVDDGW